ncbi:hypothetical protein [Flavisolibacter ginsengisoli]|jgi:hypothetical protein|uniref:Uncharacterized protein n=1 Tax=Flavisolibacter ginsengisoli DSM 18119 TaxID=1121884 RepID=A0A1M5CGL1_9BACT|nr:hypothetical protein [Flavisolibacter ginsengisoli]SHF53869.1 hypothetical protein SAMN02745131_02933 [Flavisolibacter ginsengisoli DSM 18119]
MIPGTTETMETLLRFQTEKIGYKLFDEMTSHVIVKEKFTQLGITPEITLEEVGKKYDQYSGIWTEFIKRFDFAGDKIGCIDLHIAKIRKKYETVLPGNDYISVLLNADVPGGKWHWPAGYVSYHCKMEGYNAQLKDLSLPLVSMLGFAERYIVAKIEAALNLISLGYANAKFHNSLLKKKEELTGEKHHYVPFSIIELHESFSDKINWNGTVPEFVNVIKLLIDKGYLNEFKTKESLIRTLLNHFNLRSQRGPASAGVLRDYFGNDHYTFSPMDYRLRESDNKGKDIHKKK